MKKTKKQIPNRRFKEFENDGEWENKRVIELAKFSHGGGTPRTSIKKYWYGDIPWISSSDLKENNVNQVFPTKYITEEALDNSAAKLVPKNSIAIVTRVGVGKLSLIPFDFSTSQDFISLSRLTTDEQFTAYALYRLLETEKNQTQGTSIKGITKDELLNKKITISNVLKEQSKIGEFFKKLDNLINLQQDKLAKSKDLKSAYLSELFPKEGEKYPRLRFQGFTKPWQYSNFGEILKTYSFKPYIANVEIDGEYKVIQQGDNSVIGYSSGYPFEDYSDVVLFGDHTLSLYKPEKPFFVSSDGIKILSSTNNLNRDFLYYLIEKYLPASEGYKRHYSVLKNQNCNISSNKSEQEKIGNFFKQLDDRIELEEEKLRKLEKIKEAYLNELFV